MTKKEWFNLQPKSKVVFKTWNPKSVNDELVFKGEVVRFNFGCHQCLVRFEDGNERWFGRLGIEIDNEKNNPQ